MSSINATPGSSNQISALIESADNTATLSLQTNGITGLQIDTSQNANCTTTGAITIPNGTTNARPTGVSGMIRYNTTTSRLEGCINGAWMAIV